MIHFTAVGAIHTKGREAEFLKAFETLPWKPVAEVGTVGFSQGALVDAILQQLPGGRITHYAESPTFAPFNLLAVTREMHDCMVRIFVFDEGHKATLLAVEPFPKPE